MDTEHNRANEQQKEGGPCCYIGAYARAEVTGALFNKQRKKSTAVHVSSQVNPRHSLADPTRLDPTPRRSWPAPPRASTAQSAQHVRRLIDFFRLFCLFPFPLLLLTLVSLLQWRSVSKIYFFESPRTSYTHVVAQFEFSQFSQPQQ